jgi:hypothetical protein
MNQLRFGPVKTRITPAVSTRAERRDEFRRLRLIFAPGIGNLLPGLKLFGGNSIFSARKVLQFEK